MRAIIAAGRGRRAEKIAANNGWITRIHRGIEPAAAYGEYTGIAKFSTRGAAALKAHYQRCKRLYACKPFREAVVLEKAYLFVLLQEMIEAGVAIAHADTPGHVARVREAREFLAPKRIMLNPDCGFAPGSGAAVSIGEAYRKLCNEVAAARILREQFA